MIEKKWLTAKIPIGNEHLEFIQIEAAEALREELEKIKKSAKDQCPKCGYVGCVRGRKACDTQLDQLQTECEELKAENENIFNKWRVACLQINELNYIIRERDKTIPILRETIKHERDAKEDLEAQVKRLSEVAMDVVGEHIRIYGTLEGDNQWQSVVRELDRVLRANQLAKSDGGGDGALV